MEIGGVLTRTTRSVFLDKGDTPSGISRKLEFVSSG